MANDASTTNIVAAGSYALQISRLLVLRLTGIPTERWTGSYEARSTMVDEHMAMLVVKGDTRHEASCERQRSVPMYLNAPIPEPSSCTVGTAATLPHPAPVTVKVVLVDWIIHVSVVVAGSAFDWVDGEESAGSR